MSAPQGKSFVIAGASVDDQHAVRLMRALDDELGRRYPAWQVHGLQEDDLRDVRLVFLLAHAGDCAIGCGVVRALDAHAGEVKRMFVTEEWRRRGVARRLLAALEASARDRGYLTLRIETGTGQPEAIALYQSAGYTAIPPFGEYVGNPVSLCFEKRLLPEGAS